MREGMLLQATDDVLRGELQRLREELGRLAGRLAGPCAPAAPAEAGLARALAELQQESRDAGRRLARLEGAALEELRQTRADLRALQAGAAPRWLPAGEEPPRLCSRARSAGRRGRQSPGGGLPGGNGRADLRFSMHGHRAQTHHARQENWL